MFKQIIKSLIREIITFPYYLKRAGVVIKSWHYLIQKEQGEELNFLLRYKNHCWTVNKNRQSVAENFWFVINEGMYHDN